MTATWRKQPPIPGRFNRAAPRAATERTCRRCDTVIDDTMKYCWPHYQQLSDIEKANLRRVDHSDRPRP